MSTLDKDRILDALACITPDGDDLDIVAAGMVTGLVIKGGNVGFAIDIGDTDPASMEPLRKRAEDTVKAMDGVLSATVALTAERATPEPPKMGGKPTPPPAERIPDVKAIIAVASGKGGVGKSTTAVNLALALKTLGLNVGLLDADIYGPSQPKLLGTTDKPTSDGKKITPVTAYGIKVMSMGFMVDVDSPMIWRGPMVAGALGQMLHDVNWGDLDVLVVDMPPGTGDAQLTLVQRVPVTGAVIVSTPQDIALIDARKGLKMFEQVGTPVFGIIENMSAFQCPECGHESHIFGHGGAAETAKTMGAPFLGEIPLTMDLRAASDAGTPIVETAPDGPEGAAFMAIAKKIKAELG